MALAVVAVIDETPRSGDGARAQLQVPGLTQKDASLQASAVRAAPQAAPSLSPAAEIWLAQKAAAVRPAVPGPCAA